MKKIVVVHKDYNGSYKYFKDFGDITIAQNYIDNIPKDQFKAQKQNYVIKEIENEK